MTSPTDLSVVVTVHSETCVAGPTMRAADTAIAQAEAAGLSVERMIAYDNPTAHARTYFDQSALDHWDRRDVNGGDLGPTRNAVVAEHAKGAAIAFLDADDLFSPHWLSRGMARLRAAEAEGLRPIVHPEVNWLFDGAGAVYWNPDQDDPLFAPQYFYVSNYYDSLCLAPRAAHLEHPYVTRDIARGLSFQDWQFAIETMAAGWQHVSAPGTIIFKRRRDASLVTESRGRQAIVRDMRAMRIDRVAGLGRTDAASAPAAPPPFDVSIAALAGLNARARTETPHWGTVFQSRVQRAEARRAITREALAEMPKRLAAYEAVAKVFDTAFYLAANSDVAEHEDIDPLRHYLRSGHKEDREPSPLLGTLALAQRLAAPEGKPDTASAISDWLELDPASRPLAFPFTRGESLAKCVGSDPARLQDQWAARHVDLRARLMFGDLGQEVALTAQTEPLVTQGWAEALQIKIPALHSEMFVTRQAVLVDLQRAAGERPARAVVLVNRPRFGGARRMEGQLGHALAARYGAENVVVISTDKPGNMPPGKFPPGVRHVDLAALTMRVRPHIRLRLMVLFLRSLGPEVIFNVNSRRFWEAMEPYGQALAASSHLVGCFLCNEQTVLGQWTGYPLRRFYRHFDVLAAVCTDSSALASELRTSYMLPKGDEDRVQVLAAPVRGDIALAPAPRHPLLARPRRQVFWAGRMDPQKRVDLALEVARLMPDVRLRMWGDVVSGSALAWPDLPENVTLEGVYSDFAELPLHEADAWLYTSGWDGVPQVLLEVAMAGVPVVASDVGGVTEALCSDGVNAATALMPSEAGPEAYAAALRVLFKSAKPARKAAAAHRAHLLATRTEAGYQAAVDRVLDRLCPQNKRGGVYG